MRASLKKAVVGSLAALAMGISTIATVAPASAGGNNFQPNQVQGGQHWHGNGGGHWHGNGGGHWHGGGWGPAAVGLGVLGLAAGAAIASQGYEGEDECTAYRPVYDGYGNYLGRRLVNIC
jgi:hypothetical protein